MDQTAQQPLQPTQQPVAQSPMQQTPPAMPVAPAQAAPAPSPTMPATPPLPDADPVKKKMPFMLITLIIIFVLLLLGLGYYLMSQQNSKKSPQEDITPTPVVSPTQMPTPTVSSDPADAANVEIGSPEADLKLIDAELEGL